jgi:nucleoside phosphorylase
MSNKASTSITHARRYVEYVLERRNIDLPPIPAACVISYMTGLIDLAKAAFPHQIIDLGCTTHAPIHLFHPEHASPFAIAQGHHGAPMAAVMLEELIALGFERFLSVGAAGHPCNGQGAKLEVGDIVLPDTALIFEGTSFHYRAEGDISIPAPAQLDLVSSILQANGMRFTTGRVATTDALYRETPEFIQTITERQAIALDMELSALFSVASFHGKEIAGLLYISDIISALGDWQLGLMGQFPERLEHELFAVAQAFCE